MSDEKILLVDQSGKPRQPEIDLWPSLVIPKEEIDAEIARLAGQAAPANGHRTSLFVHPRATGPGLGLAPGITVSLNVLNPGEQTKLFRHNATEVNFCIQGEGRTEIGGKRIDFKLFDVWNHPSYTSYRHINNSDAVQVILTYSNAALLQKLNVHRVDENPPVAEEVVDRGADAGREDPRKKSRYGMFPLTDDGAWVMPYEKLINPESVESNALHWPWAKVKQELNKLESLGKDYVGRRLYNLYNPMTGRFNGCSPSFFAAMTIRPPKIVDRPHRHTSAAINYYFQGSGRSTVEGEVIEWKAGDLMLSAPGWAVHNHASHDEPVHELTIQDQPLQIAMESLLWQEDLKLPVALLGAQPGFGTNRKNAVNE